ncbi:hypothetical protein FRB95_007635 [Tulasnella sp. JGI-2019a]|nr:hypothetical protein FRB95_007635 [Tulasnella sp. JGI-2019a]
MDGPGTPSHHHLINSLADGFRNDHWEEESPEFPALPSATSWTLDGSLGHLWCWRDALGRDLQIGHRSSQADEDEMPSGRTIKVEKKVVMNQGDKSTITFPTSSVFPLSPTRPLTILKPKLRLEAPPHGHVRRQESSSSLLTTTELSTSPSSTIISHSPPGAAGARPDMSDVWKAVEALQISWEYGDDDLVEWIFGKRCGDDSDSDDGLVSLMDLMRKEKGFGGRY